MTLKPLDLQCIEFLAQLRGVAPEMVRDAYVAAKQRFRFVGGRYRHLCAQVHALLAPLYGNGSEKELVSSYQYHGLLHLYRHISYSYWKLPLYQERAQAILARAAKGSLAIVDYGCGLGYLSEAIARARPGTRIYLVDVAGLVLDFAAFRFQKLELDFETIPVTRGRIYPKLPAHNLCIVTEVWEHLQRPMMAYENIHQAMEEGGLLVGKIADHKDTFFHVSPDLAELQERVAVDFELLAHDIVAIYRKR